jgi:3-oxoacyl-ACP reductase-like protein
LRDCCYRNLTPLLKLTAEFKHRNIRERNMTLFDMKGKVAVITGSTRGIGRAIAERMAEHGAKVVISSRKADVCEQVAKEINDS